jgi:thiol-disulfide isomerase/thioredoxin
MSMRILPFSLAVATLVVALPFAQAQVAKPAAAESGEKAPILSVGDKAPALTIEKWLKGTPVASFEKGKVYVVEFWATWCPPCIASMPHLSELQKKYKERGLTIIGVSSVDTRGNSLEKSEKMVADKGDLMGYTVAWDTKRATSDAWFKAAGQNGIPCSFLVDGNGKIAYIGHPMNIEETLDQVVAGKHDIRALAEKYKSDQELDTKSQSIGMELNKAYQAQDWPTVLAKMDEMLALDVKKFGNVAAGKFDVIANQLKDIDKAYAFAKEFSSGVGKDSAEAMNGIAWMIVDPKSKLARQDLDLALKLAERADEIMKHENAAILDTLARVHFVRGDVKKAVEIETKAAAKDPGLKKTLDEYTDALAKKTN